MRKILLSFLILCTPVTFATELETKNDTSYIKKIYEHPTAYKKYFPDKEIELLGIWKASSKKNCNEKELTCKYLRTRLISYTDGTIVEERLLSETSPPNFALYDGKKEEVISRIFLGVDSAKKQFPDKTIDSVSSWNNDMTTSCSYIEKMTRSGKSSRIVKIGKKCSKKLIRFINYTDGTVVKESRIINDKVVW